MKKSIGLLLSICVAFIVLHLLILCQIIPYDMVWGGRLTSVKQMQSFELISIVVLLFLILLLLIKGEFINLKKAKKVVNGCLWFFFGFFIINSIGNLFATTLLEKSFTIVTLLMSVLLFKILRTKSTNHQ